eukprot:gene10887-17009_t
MSMAALGVDDEDEMVDNLGGMIGGSPNPKAPLGVDGEEEGDGEGGLSPPALRRARTHRLGSAESEGNELLMQLSSLVSMQLISQGGLSPLALRRARAHRLGSADGEGGLSPPALRRARAHRLGSADGEGGLSPPALRRARAHRLGSADGEGNELLMQLSSLVSMQLISQTQGQDDPLDAPKYMCNLPEKYVHEMADNMGIALNRCLKYA